MSLENNNQVVTVNESTPSRIIKAVIPLVAAIPLGGFVLGFIMCEDCGVNIFGRAFIGIIYAFLTAITGGFPYSDFAEGNQYNAWPYIGAVALILYLLRWRKSASRSKNP